MKTKSLQTACLGVLLFAATLSSSRAQNYSIGWYTIDGGGGTSTNGQFSLTGTIGQPDAGGRMTNGQFSVSGGFWTIQAVQTPDAPPLFIASSNAAVIVSWPYPADGWVLDQTSALSNAPAAAVWTQVPFPYQTNANRISVTLPAPSGNRFFRLRRL